MPEKCRKRADMSTQAMDGKSLARAFKDWDFTVRLGENPLSHLRVVEHHRATAGYADSDAGRGRALREVLKQVVDSLAPPGDSPNFHEKRWRSYLILRERFMNGLGRDYVADQLGLALSTYNHEQKRALDEAGELLLAWEAEGPIDTALDGQISKAEMRPPFTAPPQPPQGLVGREALLAELHARLTGQIPDRWLALYGLPGVGKTSLAIETTHLGRIREHFHDGILWAGLGMEADPSYWLSQWGTALGMRAETLAALDNDQKRAQAVLASIGDRHMLLVVDDVWKIEDGELFRIGGPNSRTLFTTRFPAVAHALAPGAALLVPELDERSGIQLLGRYVPSLTQRLETAAEEVVTLASGLPMALVLIGGYLRSQAYSGQSRRLAEALEQLRSIDTVLEVPGTAAESQTLEKVVALSEAALTPGGVDAFRALALHPPKPGSFPEGVAVRMIGGDAAGLDELVDMGLLEVVGDERYSMHSSISAYGRIAEDQVIQTQYIDAWLHFLLEEERDALAIQPETANIQQALDFAQKHGDWQGFIRGINGLYPTMERSGQVVPSLTYLKTALMHRQHAEDPACVMKTLVNLGRGHQRLGSYEQARQYYQEALAQPDAKAQYDLRCGCYQGLGVVAFSQGDFDTAEQHYTVGLDCARENQLTERTAALLSNLGALYVSQANPEGARECFTESLRLARGLGHRSLESTLLSNLGSLAAQEENLEGAAEYFAESLELARAGGERMSMAVLLNNLGTLANDRGDPAGSQEYFKQALEEARQVGDRAQASRILANLGALSTALGAYEDAESLLKEGLAEAEGIQHLENSILLYMNLAELERFKENDAEAGVYLDQAQALAEKSGHQRYLKVLAEMKAAL